MSKLTRRDFTKIATAASVSAALGGGRALGANDRMPQSPVLLRLGMIGLDTSHVLRFAELLNDPLRPDHAPGARVVVAFKGGSPDMEQSATRIERFTAEIRDKWKVELVGSIEELCRRVDAVETLEIIAFMEAADISKARGGAPVALSEVMNEKASTSKEDAKGGKR